jgi:predicted TIM-barrel fold metal-dependent hydrolase
MKTECHRVDVHYHIIPEPYVETLAGHGITGSAWVKFPKWTPAAALKYLDRMKIRTAVTSLSTPGVWFGDGSLARRLSRICNEFQARMKSDHPGRFGAFAFLPLPDVEGALAELEYAMDDLGHEGVALLSDVDGRYLGDPSYEELFAELDRRSAVVFIHPHTDPRNKPRYEFLYPLLEWPVHTTRAVLDLLYSGRLARYPRIRYILAHGGGTVPYLAHRIAEGPGEKGRGGKSPDSGEVGKGASGDDGTPSDPDAEARIHLRLLRGLYYDAAAPGEGHLAALKELVGTRHILFGTDGGWTQALETSLKIKSLLDYDDFTPSELEGIEQGNAAALLPDLAGGNGGPNGHRA